MKIRLNQHRHCAGFFGIGESRSSATTTVSEQQATASEGSLAVGAGGKFQESGAVDLTGAQVGKLGSTELTAGGDVNVTTADPEVLKTALDRYAQLSAGFGSSLNSFVSQASEDQDKKVASLLSAIEKAKESEDTGAQNRKIFLWIIAAVVVGFIAWLSFRED